MTMDWDDLRSIWRGCAPAGELSEEEIMGLVQERVAEIRRQVAHRLREEAGYYVLLLGLTLAVSVTKFSWGILAYLLVVCLTGGLLIGTLHHHARRMRAIDLGGDLRDTLMALLARVDKATKAYMGAYLLLVLAQLSLGGLVLVLERHRPALLALGAAAGVGAMALIWWSGRSYLASRFGGYREGLLRCLADLDRD